MTYALLTAGDPAPWFHQRSFANPRYAFDTAAGRYVVLCLFGSAAQPHAAAALREMRRHTTIFDDDTASFFGVSVDPSDEQKGRLCDHYPGYRFFWDFDLTISKLYGAAPAEARAGSDGWSYRPVWYVLDPTLRILRVVPFREDQGDVAEIADYLRQLPPPRRFAGVELQAPVLLLANVFEPEFCRLLVERYETHGGEDSGFMREVAGKTVKINDQAHKRRRDHTITDARLIAQTQARIRRRVVPEIRKVHQFEVTRMERYIVACYDAADAAHFRAHRDNSTKGTAHRRFPVSINLNAEFEGGEVSFPEYGPKSFKPAVGAAVVFSCSLLHAVSRVTAGRRYAFLPFLYDDAAARLREANNSFLGDGVGAYSGSDTGGQR